MGKRQHRRLTGVALALTFGWIGWTVYDTLLGDRAPGDQAYLTGNSYFEDGHYEEALREYGQALEQYPDHLFALRGKARSLMELRRSAQAMSSFDQAIAREPEFAPTYANRGILRDRLGDYPGAIADYETALRLDPELADGPGWLTRFLRNQAQRPPTIADRAAYLKAELAKPDAERVLSRPEEDSRQRPYRL